MPMICYTPKNFRADTLSIINTAVEIMEEYESDGLILTLRQLYYQFVARDLLRNTEKNYKRLGSIINDGRMAGFIDWESIEDRTREVQSLPHWESPGEIVKTAANSYRLDSWEGQEFQPEVWVEKEALAGIAERACVELDVPFFSCRGYVSQSEMWVAAQRLIGYGNEGRQPVIIHLGDHDPSGIDMTRDIIDRMATFFDYDGMGDLEVRRVALNMDQVRAYRPPPNPAKTTDSRFGSYIRKFGGESWELDALEPKVLVKLIQDHIRSVLDADMRAKVLERQEGDRAKLLKLAASL